MRIQIKYGKENKVSYEIFSFQPNLKASDVFREFAYMCNNLAECPVCVLSRKTVKCPHWRRKCACQDITDKDWERVLTVTDCEERRNA